MEQPLILLLFLPVFFLLNAVILVCIIHTIEFGSLVQYHSEPLRIIQTFYAHL